MTLTGKILFSVAVTVSVCLLFNVFFVQKHLEATFDAYEDKDVARNTARVLQAFDATYDRLDDLDWSQWTETYDYLAGQNADFEAQNLQTSTLENIGINFMVLADRSGEIVWSDCVDLETGSAVGYDESFLPPYLDLKTELDADGANGSYRGIISTRQGPMLVASGPVVKNDGSGVPTGTILMGRFLDESWVRETAQSTHVNFKVHDLNARVVPGEIDALVRPLTAGHADHIAVKEEDHVYDYALMRDLSGRPVVIVEVQTPRDVRAQGRHAQDIATATILTAGLVIIVVILLIVHYIVTKPLHGLTNHIRYIRDTGQLRRIEQIDTRDEIGVLAQQFDNLMKQKIVAEDRSRLLTSIIERAEEAIAVTDVNGHIQYVNPVFAQRFGGIDCDNADCSFECLFKVQSQSSEDYDDMLSKVMSGDTWTNQLTWTDGDGGVHEEQLLVSPVKADGGEITNIALAYRDITEINAMERKLNQAQKLESVGQLAAGVAHEINTPSQYVADNTQFLKDSFDDLNELLAQLTTLAAKEEQAIPPAVIRKALEEADADFLREEIPTAIAQSADGIARISKIVRAMKEFSHPASEQSQVDINRAIESTVTVASNEWKYVANMKLDLADDLPAVYCNPGQINQVVLNMIVNAAHALADSREAGDAGMGNIAIETSHSDSFAEIRISDDGTGMPEDVKVRIFDPFFTTKEVGKGTGQGLSIAYDVIVNKHNGTIAVESEPGEGTCFIIRLPICAQDDDANDNAHLDQASGPA